MDDPSFQTYRLNRLIDPPKNNRLILRYQSNLNTLYPHLDNFVGLEYSSASVYEF